MSICCFLRERLARSISRAMLAAALLLTPAVGLLPVPALAQDAVDFRSALEGYGQWVQHPRWGEVWIPEQVPPDWQPYRVGHWVYSDEWGWYWDSEEDFGWITYHYGRWLFDRGLGWIWIPDTQWGPAWVDWRQGDDFVGWAPLPPDEYLDEDYETPDTYMFVRAADLMAPQVYLVVLPPRERFVYYNRSFLVNRTVFLRSGARIGINPGVPPAFIARASGRPFRPVSIAPVVLAGTAGVAGAVILREHFRDRDRTRIQIRETDKFIQPNDRFVPLKPLQKGERGQLGGITPSAARGVGVETTTKNFGAGGTFRNQTIQPGNQIKTIQPPTGGGTTQQQDFRKKTFEDKSLQKNLQDGQQKSFEQKKFEQRKLESGTPNFQQQNLQNQQQQIRREQFERKELKQDLGKQNLQQQNLQQQNTQQFKQQNLERKTFQQSNPPGGGAQIQQQNIQRLQQNQQQSVPRTGSQQPNATKGDKSKQSQPQ